MNSVDVLQSDEQLLLWAEQVRRALTPEDWHYIGDTSDPIAPDFQNSWTNYTTSPTTPDASFYKHQDIVYIRGIVSSGSAADAVIFTLPEGYRPEGTVRCLNTVSGGTVAYYQIRADGTVRAQAGGSTTWQSIDLIPFKAYQ